MPTRQREGSSCGSNDGQPCAWGAIKALRGLAAVPEGTRSDREQRAIEAGIEFLLSNDPADASYPMGYGNTKPSSSWFKLGFPSGYVSDVLQNLEVLCDLGLACDPRLDNAFTWLIDLADDDGRWSNRHAYYGKTTVPIDEQGQPSKWVTLRACTVLRARDHRWEPPISATRHRPRTRSATRRAPSSEPLVTLITEGGRGQSQAYRSSCRNCSGEWPFVAGRGYRARCVCG